MMRLVPILAAAGLVAAFVAAPALGKGASEAAMTGPGLGDGITLAGEGSLDGGRLMKLAEAAGFFPAVYGQSPSPMQTARPHGELGPRYTVFYAMPGRSDGGVDELRQELYPYAVPCAVSHMSAGQRYYGTQRTVGGWFVSCAALKDVLVGAGLPATPPTGSGGGFPWTIVALVAAFLAALVAGVAVVVRRSRPGPVVA
jgi:hypothetical protein